MGNCVSHFCGIMEDPTPKKTKQKTNSIPNLNSESEWPRLTSYHYHACVQAIFSACTPLYLLSEPNGPNVHPFFYPIFFFYSRNIHIWDGFYTWSKEKIWYLSCLIIGSKFLGYSAERTLCWPKLINCWFSESYPQRWNQWKIFTNRFMSKAINQLKLSKKKYRMSK